MNELGYAPCPKCGGTEVDYGRDSNKRYVFAECANCTHEVKVPLYSDVAANLRITDMIRLTREVWNERRK